MAPELKQIIVHIAIVLIASFLMIRYHKSINNWISKKTKKIKKNMDKNSRRRYASRVNREEAKLFGRDKKPTFKAYKKK